MVLDYFKKEPLSGPEFQGPLLSILHISDLHFHDPHYTDNSRARVASRFLRALDRHLEGWRARYPKEKNLCALFITGDITYQCQPEDFEKAKTLIKEILEQTGIPGERLYVVPGEHDVYLRFVKNTDDTLQFPDQETWNQFLRDERKGKSQRIAGRFTAYINFIRSLGAEFGTRMPCAASDFFYADVFSCQDQKVAVLGLNSAWSCRCRLEADRGMLCLGSYQVKEAYKRAKTINGGKDPELVLSLLHHPAEWMKPGDQDALRELSRVSHAVFRGHAHQGESALSFGQSPIPVVSTSAWYGEDITPGFSVAAIDPPAKKLYLWPYLWYAPENAFLPPQEHKPPLNDQAFSSFDLP